MATFKLSSFILCIIISLLLYSTQLEAQNHKGFSTNLIHRDSPLSPSYNPSFTKWDRVRTSVKRSMSRVNVFSLSKLSKPDGDFDSQVYPANGEYVMEMSLGTPPVSQLVIVDTGSDLIWLQCQPCLKCYKQEVPIFDPRKSSSYKLESCSSSTCDSFSGRSSCSQKDTCTYTYSYGDRSQTEGDVATETVTFGGRNGNDDASFSNVAIGCGHDNQGTFRQEGSGLVGLGGGSLSLVSQLSASVGGMFSYCLIPFTNEGNVSSKISFGQEGEVSGGGVLSTPLVRSTPEMFYYLTLDGFSVQGLDENETHIFVPFKKASNSGYSSEEGNIIIDSGTTLTLLPPEMYSDLESALVNKIQGEQVSDPSGTLQLCYSSKSGDLKIPDVTAHFSGADVILKPVNTFIEVAEDVVCLAMMAEEAISIYGNVAQTNFMVGYDLQGGKVSFKPTDCSKV